MNTIVALVIALVVLGVLVWIVRLIPFPAELAWLKTIILILIGLFFLLWLLGYFGVYSFDNFGHWPSRGR